MATFRDHGADDGDEVLRGADAKEAVLVGNPLDADRAKAGVGLHGSSEAEDERLQLDDVEVLRPKAADRTKAAERDVLGDNHQAAHLFDPVLAPRDEAAGSDSDGVDDHDGVHANDNAAASEARLAIGGGGGGDEEDDAGGGNNGDEVLRGADVKEAVLENEPPHLDESPRVNVEGSGEEEPLGGLGDAAAHHGGDANANNAFAASEARLAADLPARRWTASLLRGARFVLSPVGDAIFDLGIYVLDTPISRLVGDLVPELRQFWHGMLAFAALVAMAARPRAADHGGLDVGTQGLHEGDAAAALAALLGAGGHADHDEEVGAEEDGYAGAALGGGGGEDDDDLFDEEPLGGLGNLPSASASSSSPQVPSTAWGYSSAPPPSGF